MKAFSKEMISMGFVSIPMILRPVLSFFFLILVAHSSSIEDYGALAFSTALISLVVGFSDLGLRDYLLSKGAMRDGLSKGENLYFSSILFYFLLEIILFIYIVLAGSSRESIYIFLCFLPEAYAYGVLNKSLFFHYQKKQDIVRFSKIDSFHKTIPFILRIIVYWLTTNLIYAIAVGAVLSLLSYYVWFLVVAKDGFFSHNYGRLKSIREVMVAWRLWISFAISFLSFFLYFGFDKIIIEKISGEASLAIYAAAYSFIAVGQIPISAIWSLYMPRLSRGDDFFGQRKFLLLAFGLGSLMFISYQLFAFFVFGLFYPDRYEGSVAILAIASAFFIFRLPNVVYEMYWVAKDRYNTFVKLRVASGLFSITLNVALIPYFGVIVAAVVLVVSEMLLTLCLFFLEKTWKA